MLLAVLVPYPRDAFLSIQTEGRESISVTQSFCELWNSFSAPHQRQLWACGKGCCWEQWDILKQEGGAAVMDAVAAGLQPVGALQGCLQGCTGVTHRRRASLQAPPGYGASLNLSRQPLVIWLLMKGKNWKGLSSERSARECHWHRTHPTRGRSQHMHAACLLPAPDSGACSQSAFRLSLVKGSFSRESLLACGSCSSLSSFAARLVGGERHLNGFGGKGRDFLRLFSVAPLGNFFIRLQPEWTGSTPFLLLPSADRVGLGLLRL